MTRGRDLGHYQGCPCPRTVTSIAGEIREKAQIARGGVESKAAENKYLLNRIPWPLRRPRVSDSEMDNGGHGHGDQGPLGLSAHSFGSFVVSDIGSHGLKDRHDGPDAGRKGARSNCAGQDRGKAGRTQRRNRHPDDPAVNGDLRFIALSMVRKSANLRAALKETSARWRGWTRCRKTNCRTVYSKREIERNCPAFFSECGAGFYVLTIQ